MRKIFILFIGLYNSIFINAQYGYPFGPFGNNGYVTTEFSPSSNSEFRKILIQPDGKIIAGGSAISPSRDITLARYNSDGSLDVSFGIGGKVIFDAGYNEYITDMSLQNDGKIVVVASTFDQVFVMFRLNANGSVDAGFGNAGKVVTSYTNTDDTGPTSLLVQNDGKILVGGYTMVSNWYQFIIRRYNTNGSTDLQFGLNGITTTGLTDNHLSISAIVLQPDGKIVAAGELGESLEFHDFEYRLAIARYNADGAPDETFGNNGLYVRYADPYEGPFSAAMQSDGKIVIGGYVNFYLGSGAQFGIYRFMNTGMPDASFGDNGKVYTSMGHSGFAREVAIQADGKILAVGHRYDAITATDFAIVRYNVDGSLDETFGTDGKITADLGGFNELYGAAISGNILYATGRTTSPNNTGIVAAYVLSTSTFYADADEDGFGDISQTILDVVAPAGYVSNNTDCDDNNATVYPGANEGYDGIDNNCNGQADEGIIVQNAANVQKWSISTNDPALSISPRDKSLIASGNENYGNDLVGKKLNPLTGSALIPSFPSPGTRNSIWVSADNPQDILTGGYAGKAAFKLDGTHVWDAPFFGCCYSIPFSLDFNDKKGWIAINGQFVRIDLLTGTAIQGPYGIEAIGGYSSIADANTAYIAGQNGSVSKINSSTGQVWNVVIDAGRSLKPGAIANDGSFIVTSGNAHEGGLPEAGWLARIPSDGQNVWKQNINAVTYPVIGGNGYIYVGTQTPPVSFNGIGSISAYSVNGNNLQLVWSTPTPGLPNDIVVADNGKLYAVVGNFATGKLLELDQSTGATIRVIDNVPGAWELILQGGIVYTSGVPAYNVPGSITAIPVDANEYDPASPWPVSYHDNQRTGNKTSPHYEVDLTIITCNSDITQNNDPGQCSANLDPGQPTLANNSLELNIVGIRSDNKPLSDPYPVGSTYITWAATDENNFSRKSCVQTITVNDAELPVISAPTAVSVNTDAGVCAASNVGLGTPTVSDNCPGVTYSNNAPTSFPKGITSVVWKATDAAGNTATTSQVVTVNDNEKPVIQSCAIADIHCYNTGNTYNVPQVLATDNCNNVVYIFTISGNTVRSGTGNDASGYFNTGNSTIYWSVSDGNGNISTCTTGVFIDKVDVSIQDSYAGGITPSIGLPNTVYIGYGSPVITLFSTVNATVGPNSFTYKWTIGAPSGQAFNTNASISVSPTNTTVYFLSVKDNFGCKPLYQVFKQVNVADIRCGTGKILVCEKQRDGSFITKCVSSKNLNLPPGSYLGSCTNATQTDIVDVNPVKENNPPPELFITASPNPSNGVFTIVVNSDDKKQPINLRIVDVWGQTLITKSASSDQTVRIGENLRAGVYLVVAILGNNRQVLKLIKQ